VKPKLPAATAAVACAVALAVSVPMRASASPAGCPVPPPSQAQPWLDPSYTPACRATYVVAALPTLDDKIAAISGSQLATMGIPVIKSTDGPNGLATSAVIGTSFPAAESLGASFDPRLARARGTALATEYLRAGYNNIIGPDADTVRTWHFGRTAEELGEDPFLTSALIAPEVAAIQRQHVLSTVKHFVAYNQDQARSGDGVALFGPSLPGNHGVNETVSDRALNEIYYPPFKAAVQQGGAGAVMCAFPSVNGSYNCQNPATLGELKQAWGFSGTVVPDFPDGQRSLAPSVNAGLDQGNFGTGGADLKQAVLDGQVTLSRLDNMIYRAVFTIFRLGIGAPATVPAGSDPTTPATRATAVTLAEQGAVLLKNARGALPLATSGSDEVSSIAVIGSQAGSKPIVSEAGGPYVSPQHLTTAIAGITARAGSAATVSYAQGSDPLKGLPLLPGTATTTPDGSSPGLLATYYPSNNWTGTPVITRVEQGVAVSSPAPVAGLPPFNQWSVRYTGTLTPSRSGRYAFSYSGAGSGSLIVGGKKLGTFSRTDMSTVATGNITLTAHHPVSIQVDYTPRSTAANLPATPINEATFIGAYARVGWQPPTDDIASAVALARKSDVAVVFAANYTGEGSDRLSLALPGDQDQLIQAVARANPRTIVVLNTAGPVTMPWLKNVAGVLEMWYPGDALGTAAAGLLFGDVNPSGRLPQTFPASAGQGPGTTPVTYPGIDDISQESFSEGIDVGYRYWEAHGQRPLFPFGFGLSYTRFRQQIVSARSDAAGVDLRVRVSNTGPRAGADVVQVYVGDPAQTGEPWRQLKGIAKVALAPGASRIVTVHLDPRSFAYWSDSAHTWRVLAGHYQVELGASAAQPLDAVTLRRPARNLGSA
jgi:beta-glucosidase